jgi:hypothetical protein
MQKVSAGSADPGGRPMRVHRRPRCRILSRARDDPGGNLASPYPWHLGLGEAERLVDPADGQP